MKQHKNPFSILPLLLVVVLLLSFFWNPLLSGADQTLSYAQVLELF